MEKIDARKLPKESLNLLKDQTIRLLKQGHKQVTVARLLGIRAATVSEWSSKYKQGGKKALHTKKRGVKTGQG